MALTTLPDGRTFPTYDGEVLSWDSGLYMTLTEEKSGYPRARAVLGELDDFALRAIQREMLKASLNQVFGANAKRHLRLIEGEIARRTEPAM